MPSSYFRYVAAQLAVTDEAHATFFAGTIVTREEISSPDFAMKLDDLWIILDNVVRVMGAGWYFKMPGIWSANIQGDLELSMRAAPTLQDAIKLAVTYGSVRVPLLRWNSVTGSASTQVYCEPLYSTPTVHLQMLGALTALVFQSVLEAAYPGLPAEITHTFVGDCPVEPELAERNFHGKVLWNAEKNGSFVPNSQLGRNSLLADPRIFTTSTQSLAAQLPVSKANWQDRVSRLIEDAGDGRLTGELAALRLGLSVRSLERKLAAENTSFRDIRDAVMMSRLHHLIKKGDLNLSQIAERLGYSDETALSRATRRWFGSSASEIRKQAGGKSGAFERIAS